MNLLLLFLLAILPQLALSQVYKCTDIKGKITYSESPCSQSTKGSEIYLDPNVIDSSSIRERIANDKLNVFSTSSSDIKSTRPLMSDSDKQNRLSALKIDFDDLKGTPEERTDAQNEYNLLLRNQVYSLSYDHELERKNLKVDLQSYDRSRRLNARLLLSTLYMKYLSP